ncbi:SDR family oxidoreductase [Solitalea lacus]|uniref:SDR family oxidoreductase n=1 Tax=Solitalea lacus TaxID=2911172 RepID=UPI001EDBB480|nr:NmrA family NAD(P)-binding protein [Solitalea lacus]UKJ09111.1 NmrA family NAD(P)-binding protein [Solitalea lacus]
MKILVIGGTGTVGSKVVDELRSRNVDVSVLTRNTAKIDNLPHGVKGIQGDLLDVETIRSAFKGMDGVFMLNGVSLTETHEGIMAVNGARMAGVKRFVYMSVHNLDLAPYLPHFGSKISIEIAIKASGIPYTILRPNHFYQNDYMFKDALLQYNVWPQPIGNIGLSRVDVRDIAEAAAIALTTDGHDGKTYNLVGPDVFTGNSVAETWSNVLGRPIVYVGDDLITWEQQALNYLPAWLVFDLSLMFAYFQKNGLKATTKDIELLTQLLGHTPRSFIDFAKETANEWQKA